MSYDENDEIYDDIDFEVDGSKQCECGAVFSLERVRCPSCGAYCP